MLIPGLDHFAQDLLARLPDATGWEVRPFAPSDLPAALAWTDNTATDAVWFEFCWPPFPQLIQQTDFAGRRVIVRVHRIEAYEANYVARTSWAKVDDVVVVSHDMARRVRKARARNRLDDARACRPQRPGPRPLRPAGGMGAVSHRLVRPAEPAQEPQPGVADPVPTAGSGPALRAALLLQEWRSGGVGFVPASGAAAEPA